MQYLNELNPHQREAVEHVDGSSVILAGAGSGKTKTIVAKVIHLIEQYSIDPRSIVMITFTNKAGNEMRERIARAFDRPVRLGYVGTFHSFCSTILRQSGHHVGLDAQFAIYDTEDQQTLMKGILKDVGEERYKPSYYTHRISQAKNMLLTPNKYRDVFVDYRSGMVAEIYTRYQKKLRKNNAVDFDDLIMYATSLFAEHPDIQDQYHSRYQYLFVDEFQDTNYAQYVLTKQLGERDGNVTVVGDFSQSIYSWRGADIKNLEKFTEDFPRTKTFHLEQNYRSTQNVLDLAFGVISQNRLHPVLQLRTDNPIGDAVSYYTARNEEDEARYVASIMEHSKSDLPYSSYAILYRMNAQSRALEEALLHMGIPYTLIGGTRFYERKEVKDVLSYLRLTVNPSDEIATNRIKKLGKRRWESFRRVFQHVHTHIQTMTTLDIMEEILNATSYLDMYDANNPEEHARLENIRELKSVASTFTELVAFLEQIALVESEYSEKEKTYAREGVKLMTLHQAKGLEFPYVFITGLEEGILPHARSLDDSFGLEEERRLFYVGITRAQKKLYITHARHRLMFGSRQTAMPSQFIQDMI